MVIIADARRWVGRSNLAVSSARAMPFGALRCRDRLRDNRSVGSSDWRTPAIQPPECTRVWCLLITRTE
jgi:hypothetical protein